MINQSKGSCKWVQNVILLCRQYDSFCPFFSGDIGQVNSDGYFTITDRLKEMIKYKAFAVRNFFPVDTDWQLVRLNTICAKQRFCYLNYVYEYDNECNHQNIDKYP